VAIIAGEEDKVDPLASGTRHRTQRFRTLLHNGRTAAATRHRHSGSIYGVAGRFQPFRINNLELVAQICPRWNRLQPWFELVGAFKDAA
jgi:hypothetical protein